ncbi:MAG: hypothetical protein K2X46_16680 [Roseomonas sp.]|nr:hypothetical protein [Roseomonas sp.]
MSLHARIVGGQVVELIAVPEGAELSQLLHPDLVAQCAAVPGGIAGQVAEGWAWDAEAGFSAPAAPEPPAPVVARHLTPLSFRRRLSAEVRARITLAASRALEAGDATLQVFLDDLAAAQVVDLDNADLVAGVAALFAAELITEAERAVLLADAAPHEAA